MLVNGGFVLCIIFLKNKKERSIIKMSFLNEWFSAGVWGKNKSFGGK